MTIECRSLVPAPPRVLIPKYYFAIFVSVLFFNLLTVNATAQSRIDSIAIREAKATLREHLKSLNQSFPFAAWSLQLEKAKKDLERLRTSASKRPIEVKAAEEFRSFESKISGLSAHRVDVQKLINEMYVQVVAFRIEERFRQQGKIFSVETRDEFVRQLKPYEAGSLQPKTAFLAGLAALEQSYAALRDIWMVAYAEGYLAHYIEGQLKGFDLQKNESLYDAYSLQLDYWRGQVGPSGPKAGHAREELKKLADKWKSDKQVVQDILSKLTDVLNTDMLFSQLLEAARKDGVDFPLEVEERLEMQLRSKQAELRDPLEQRKLAWNGFQSELKALMERVDLAYQNQQNQAEAEAEQIQQEAAQLAALRAEQENQEKEQKEKFKQTLNALKSFTFKGETSVSLDEDASKALGTQSGFLKSSYVGSGQVKLKVGKVKFSDTLAYVNKFSMAEGSIDLSKMSLEEKTSQSAYVYTSPKGRTSQQDLESFVGLVALGSFSTGFTFFSYVPSGSWRPDSRIRWKQDKAGEAAARDRNFSYVDMVVDAHKKYNGAMAAGDSRTVVRSVNVPANMILIFDDRGGIKRFFSFGDVSEISLTRDDLTGGKLYFKFLNYSTDRSNIYLNGIDPEIKTSSPNA